MVEQGSVSGHGVSGHGVSGHTRRTRRMPALSLAMVMLLAAAGCGRSDEEAETVPAGGDDPDAAATASTTAPGDAAPGEFGDLGRVCGPAPEGAVLEATDVGVTAQEIQLGTISDPGFSGRPGLNQEIFDSAEAFTRWCNEAGGINGRSIDLVERDARLTEYQPRMIEACDEGDFMLVGGGGVFDDQGQGERLACGLPNLAGFVVNPPAVQSDLTIAPLLNRPESIGIGDLEWLGEQFPEATQKIGMLTAGGGRDPQRRRAGQAVDRASRLGGRLRRAVQRGRRGVVARVRRGAALVRRPGSDLGRRPGEPGGAC